MNIKEMTKEELELLSYKDITAMYIKSEGPSKTADVFKFITSKLELSKAYFESKIGDYYTMLSTDKRFVLVDGIWDLREKYSSDAIKVKKVVDEDDEEELEEEAEITEDDSLEGDFDNSKDDDEDFDDGDDDLKNLVIIDEDELELD